MIGTLFSLLIAVFIFLHPVAKDTTGLLAPLGYLLFGISAFLCLSSFLVTVMAWQPLQRAEQKITPRVLELYTRDKSLQIGRAWLVFFPLITLLIVADLIFVGYVPRNVLLAVWVVLFGISLDFLTHSVKRVMSYLSPFMVVEMFTNEAKHSIKEEHEMDLYRWLDALSEVGTKSTLKNMPTLAVAAIDEMQLIVKHFLDSNKSISHHNQDSETKKLGISDKISYTLFYVFQRMELLMDKALEARQETICSSLVTNLGKILVNCAKFDMSLGGYPVHYIGKFATAADRRGLQEVGVKASITLLESAKIILNEVDIQYYDLKDTFLSITHQLDEISQEAFKQDKGINIALLKQPLYDLRKLFETEKAAKHQDTPTIVAAIDQVIAQFETLEVVLKTMPPIAPPEQAPPAAESQ